ncbi:PREDICTED: coiled-coil domain-containing protein 86 [Trachymyrmex cornetzi]|uniref:Coiled-coil domain-containing protein 86 n=1 Tax=Trachymyrmex cornetzi TaxID=471704 RepID=A0A151JPR8_9HYME|nr:PREDICTED: coiled-coil domain-containing protein 86 [Trachymyrmex cornetzi]KYN29089.1 Coiled-coil domain-containing protein 86 [Trachymyrmex cornetzi]
MANLCDEKVTRMEDILNTASVLNKPTLEQLPNTEKRERQHIPRGKPKSGRIWKEEKTKFSSIIKTRGIRQSFAKKQKLREDLKRVKEMSRAIKAQKQAEKETKKQRRRENLKRAEENRKKSEIVQIIKNTAKIKRMKKKQLRMIEKRDTTNM